MQKKFLSGLFLIILLNLLVKPFFILGIDAEVQNRVGEEIYGNYFALLNFSLVLNIFLDMGIANYNTRNIARHPELVTAYFYRILWLRCVLFIIYAVVCTIAALSVGYSAKEFYLLLLLMINQFLVAVIQFSRSNLGGLHLFKTDAVISVLDRAMLIIFCSILLWTKTFSAKFNIEWFVYAQTLAYGLTAITSLVLLSPYAGKVKMQWQKNFSFAIIKKCFPYALLILLMMFYTRTDSVMIERLLPDGDAQAGMYAQGYRYLDAVNMIGFLFAGLLLPVFSRLIKTGEPVVTYVDLSLRLLGTAAVIIGTVGFLYSKELLELRYEAVTEAAVKSFGLLILGFIPIALSYIYGTLLTANENLKQLNYMAAGCLLINFSLNLVLIRSMKVEGAATAMLITQWAATLTQIILAHRILKITLNLAVAGSLILLAVILVATFYMIRANALPFGISIISVLATGLVIAFALRLLRFGDFRQMMGKE